MDVLSWPVHLLLFHWLCGVVEFHSMVFIAGNSDHDRDTIKNILPMAFCEISAHLGFHDRDGRTIRDCGASRLLVKVT